MGDRDQEELRPHADRHAGEKEEGQQGQEGEEAEGCEKAEEKEEEEEGREEEEEEAEEEKEEEVAPRPERQAREGPAQEQGNGRGWQEDRRQDEEGRQGHFKPVTVSSALAKVTGISGKTTRGQVFKALWAYIKKKGLNKGRTVGKIDGIWNGGSMFKMTAAVSKHVK